MSAPFLGRLEQSIEMMQDGYQPNLSDAWHSEAMKHAAEDMTEAREEILRLQKLVEEMTWRPIETAPATGRFLAAYIDPDELAAGNPDPYEGIEVLSGPHKFRSGKMTWLNHNSGNYSTFPATHWMPMPPLPSKALSNKEETK